MPTILETIQKKRAFDAFVNENMKNSTYKVGWDAEMDVEYEASKSWTAATADYAAAMLGTVIDDQGGRPKRDMPSIGELSGAMVRMGDEWQMDNDRLERYYYMEQRFRDMSKNLSEEVRKEQWARLVKYLFDPYEKAAIAPHKRIYAQYLEGLSDGQITLTKTNNAGGIVWSAAIGVGITKNNLASGSVTWSSGNLATMDVLATLQYAEDKADAAGRSVIKHRVSKATKALICQSAQLKGLIGRQVGTITTATSPALGLDVVNEYLVNIADLKPIEVVDEKAVYTNGTSVSLFKDGRVVSQCADKVAVLKVKDPLETVDPVPNKVYTSFKDNLISQWRNEQGRYIAYEMFAFPAFVGKNDVFILDVTQTD